MLLIKLSRAGWLTGGAPRSPQVVTAAAELLGCLSHTRLASITAAFLAEVGGRIRSSEESQARRELVSLCNGMRYVRLAGGTPEQLRSSTDFLERCHPLKHVAPDKKSRLQHVLCTMLTNVLQPLVDEGDPRYSAGERDVRVLRAAFYMSSVCPGPWPLPA